MTELTNRASEASRPLPDDRAMMVRWLAYLLVAGGVLAVLALIFLPLPGSTDRTGSLVNALAAIGLAGLLYLSRRHVPGWAIPPILFASIGIISLSAYFWGTAPGDDAMSYVWIVLYAAYFFPGRQAAIYLAAIGVAYALVLFAQNADQAGSARWAVTMTTLAVAAAVISRLVRALRDALATQARQADEREAMLSRMETAALTDELTGLPNRRAWEEQFAREINRARREGSPICVALLDLDLFKSYNDTHGHPAGDRLLKDASMAWRAELRGGDVLARYGGEEFAVLLPGCRVADARALIERLRAATPPARTVSAGLAAWDRVEGAHDLLERADCALYEAKAVGRDRSVLATPPGLRAPA